MKTEESTEGWLARARWGVRNGLRRNVRHYFLTLLSRRSPKGFAYLTLSLSIYRDREGPLAERNGRMEGYGERPKESYGRGEGKEREEKGDAQKVGDKSPSLPIRWKVNKSPLRSRLLSPSWPTSGKTSSANQP